jgi:SanA protein
MHRLVGLVRRTLRRRVVRVTLGLGVAGAFALVLANAVVLVRAHGRASDSVAAQPHAQVAIVPGALVDPQGRMSAMLRDRVDGGVALYRAGKVDRILVSGDHGRLGYDETDTMRDAVLHAGVPAEDVFTDYAGFDTWSTMARAKRIFGVRSAIVVTQGFHAARAIDLGRAAGIDTHGLVIDGAYGAQGRRSSLRELVARAKGLEQATLKPGVMPGPKLPITGDGRDSWGPKDPQAPVAQLRP